MSGCSSQVGARPGTTPVAQGPAEEFDFSQWAITDMFVVNPNSGGKEDTYVKVTRKDASSYFVCGRTGKKVSNCFSYNPVTNNHERVSVSSDDLEILALLMNTCLLVYLAKLSELDYAGKKGRALYGPDEIVMARCRQDEEFSRLRTTEEADRFQKGRDCPSPELDYQFDLASIYAGPKVEISIPELGYFNSQNRADLIDEKITAGALTVYLIDLPEVGVSMPPR